MNEQYVIAALNELSQMPHVIAINDSNLLNVISGCNMSSSNYGLELNWGNSSGNVECSKVTLSNEQSIAKFMHTMRIQAASYAMTSLGEKCQTPSDNNVSANMETEISVQTVLVEKIKRLEYQNMELARQLDKEMHQRIDFGYLRMYGCTLLYTGSMDLQSIADDFKRDLGDENAEKIFRHMFVLDKAPFSAEQRLLMRKALDGLAAWDRV